MGQETESNDYEWTQSLMDQYQPPLERTDGTVSYISASQTTRHTEKKIVNEHVTKKNGPGIGTHRELMNDTDLIDEILVHLCHKANSQ